MKIDGCQADAIGPDKIRAGKETQASELTREPMNSTVMLHHFQDQWPAVEVAL